MADRNDAGSILKRRRNLLTCDEKKERRKEAVKKYDSTKVAIGVDNIDMWRELRAKLGGDTQVARHLLLLHEHCHFCDPSLVLEPSTQFYPGYESNLASAQLLSKKRHKTSTTSNSSRGCSSTSNTSAQSTSKLKNLVNLIASQAAPRSSLDDTEDSDASTVSTQSGSAPIYSDNDDQPPPEQNWTMTVRSYNDCAGQSTPTDTSKKSPEHRRTKSVHLRVMQKDKQNTTQAGSHVNKTYPALAQSLFGHSRQLRPEALSKNSEERNPHTIFSVSVDDSEEVHLMLTLYDYQQIPHLCDVTLISSDGEEFSAHAAVLAAASPDLEQKLCECPCGNYTVNMALSSADTHQFIRFAYTGAQNTSSHNFNHHAKSIVSRMHRYSEKGLFCNMAWHRTVDEIQPTQAFLVIAKFDFLSDHIMEGSCVSVTSTHLMRSVINTQHETRTNTKRKVNATYPKKYGINKQQSHNENTSYQFLYVCGECKIMLKQKPDVMMFEREDGKETLACDLCCRGFTPEKLTYVTVCANNFTSVSHEKAFRNTDKL